MLKAPQLQNATDTINTLSARLVSATLLEDKRASILGLRSFAKGYPASVASGSLRELIACLRDHGGRLGKDGEGDLDTVRSVLETLLMLFNPDPDSPEASEDISFWLADEFSQRQDNITILLDLLEVSDYYARIYTLQLLTAIATARPERTQQCILAAPLGTTRLVTVLDDGRDAVRDAALLLLVDLTSVSQTDLQKLIAFEDAFPRIFKLMDDEGGVAEGGVVVQDCLSLLANLVRHSSSNQSLFRETGCLARLFGAVKQAGIWDEDENEFGRSNREKNAWGLLAVLRLFLERGEIGTKTNQDAFWKVGIVQIILDLAFDAQAPIPVRSSAMNACADMITSNPPLQESFASLGVIAGSDKMKMSNGSRGSNGPTRVYVIEALLGLLLGSSSPEQLDLRRSSAVLVKAYCLGHQRIRHHFLQRAIAGFVDGEDETSNVLSAIMASPHGSAQSDPLRVVFAADILAQLVIEDDEAKAMVQAVSEGNADKGEDVVTAIQNLSGHLTFALQNDSDPRIAIAYLTLLSIAFFDSQLVINDCLTEGSSLLGALVDTANKCKDSTLTSDELKGLLPGLCAFLLGIIYEFSSKDSPISRRTLQPLLIEKLGRQKYFEALRLLRQHPYVRDSELMSEIGVASGQGMILFDPSFVELFKEEYGRMRRAIDKDPGIEVVGKKDGGVDRDVLDELRNQLASKEEAIQQLEQGSLMLQQASDKSSADHRREIQGLQASYRSMENEVERVRKINENLQREHELELNRLKEDMSHEVERAQSALKSQAESQRQQHDKEVDRLKGQHGANLASERSLWEERIRKATEQATTNASKQVDDLKDQIQKRDNELVVNRQDLKTARTDIDKLKDELEQLRKAKAEQDEETKKLKDLQANLQQVNGKAMARVKSLEDEAKRAEGSIGQVTEQRDSLRGEKDTLLTKIQELKEDVEGLKMELSTERKGYAELEAEIEAARTKTKEAESKAKAHQSEVEKAKSDLDKVKSDLEKASKPNKSSSAGKEDNKQIKELKAQLADKDNELKGELERKSKEVETSVEDAKKARSELDDMLMVMSDIEAKRDEYKERLKKAGQPVSEDEGDEDEDDEADDDGELD